ncbi:sulfate transporter [Mycobacterium paraintracellulare]|uniref:STAS domain-containing protein n=1 Tax=Mycobacterium paraintracellulare TaxID=1138383 RepID=UPI001925C6E7|nr:STAS domain-containing protein [Mycobacterium paraintracellulare]BCP11754.1 sulfate transporter [Mycobacterium paraintracellulare]
MTGRSPAPRIALEPVEDAAILTVQGVLDSSTYRTIRDAVIKAAIAAPRAVIVDINGLHAPSASAWTVFTSARWHVSVWPDVPILLVCEQPVVRRAITRAGVTRYVPMHPDRKLALEAVHGQSVKVRRRARTELSRSSASIDLARTVVADWLTNWDIREVIAVAATVATVFVENVLDHTESVPVLIVESYQDIVSVAVEDNSPQLPARHEDADRGAHMVSGLAIVSAVSRRWGATPTLSGKTVWALVGRENRL